MFHWFESNSVIYRYLANIRKLLLTSCQGINSNGLKNARQNSADDVGGKS